MTDTNDLMPPSDPSTRARSSSSFFWWRAVQIVSLGLLIAVTAFAAGMLTERNLVLDGLGSGGEDEFDRVDAVGELLTEEYYYRPTDPEQLEEFRRQLAYGALAGMTTPLEDEYTSFLVPADAGPIAAHLSGEYEGIGVTIESRDGNLVVLAPLPGSPAAKAGLLPKDVIEAADGHVLHGLTVEEAAALVRGPAGSTVRLTIRRPGVPEPFAVEVVREKLTQPAVTYEIQPGTKVAVIRILVFGDQTIEQLDGALQQARTDGATGVVLDLRNNGGGWVTSAQETIGRFVPTEWGPALFRDEDPTPENTPESLPILGGGQQVYDLPLVVLVNEGTASASEIVAGALKDYGRAKIIGARTFGKGSVQRVHNFDDGSSARITIAQWLTPQQRVIEDQGIEPDIVIPPAPADGTPVATERPAQDVDAEQLRAAIELLSAACPSSQTTPPPDADLQCR